MRLAIIPTSSIAFSIYINNCRKENPFSSTLLFLVHVPTILVLTLIESKRRMPSLLMHLMKKKLCYIGLISLWGIRQCYSLNDEGLALLEFQGRINSDPYGALSNWNPSDSDPCNWWGVKCVDGNVQMLDLKGLCLEGTLAPELGKLSHLKSIVLCKNKFYGTIPNELGDLTKLELLDLRENNFNGRIPTEIGKLLLLKHFVWRSNFRLWNKLDSLISPIKEVLVKFFNSLALPLFKLGKAAPHGSEENYCDDQHSSAEPELVQNVPGLVNFARRRLLDQSSNLAAAPVSGELNQQIISLPTTLSSGSFPAVPDDKKQNQSPPAPSLPQTSNQGQSAGNQADHSSSGNLWKYIIIIAGVAILFLIALVLFFIWRKRGAKTSPWKTGISGQLQKAFVTGVPNLNRAELETACEDFSNIIDTVDDVILYKGTLSSGVEIAVVSTLVDSSKDWSKSMEMAYRKKIATLSRINHKNFSNLIGYCEEEQPFTRMMVFEYAPNGTLSEHLHVKELENLDWSARMRVIMGIAYCLKYMHQDLNPPIAHPKLTSDSIFLTDDFAAKLTEITSGKKAETVNSNKEASKSTELPAPADPETNVYDFGVLLLETISGKLPNSKEDGNLVEWASQYLNDKRGINYIVDPSLQSIKDNELDVVSEVIRECIQSDPRLRPTMKDIALKLRGVLGITPEQAVPRLSPLWWAELEILSVEAT
ncbi:hypothetical protein L6164_017446 [Bauhinia variegata]|uniref:Uncharacterized protein n=1 Tax=Bauhinia variegata TaxID=167791 RepID=A0ACB9N987_BAUVA|nr:hypothetical protein L6164_017446 [Bauhinia variegata]